MVKIAIFVFAAILAVSAAAKSSATQLSPVVAPVGYGNGNPDFYGNGFYGRQGRAWNDGWNGGNGRQWGNDYADRRSLNDYGSGWENAYNSWGSPQRAGRTGSWGSGNGREAWNYPLW